MGKLTALSKILIAFIALGATLAAIRTYSGRFARKPAAEQVAASDNVVTQTLAAQPSTPAARLATIDSRPLRVAIATWPGHMPFVIGNGGLSTRPGSAAEREGLKLEISLIDDPAAKNKGLQSGELDFVWQTVDELPIGLGGYQQANVDIRVFLQLDWSRGGDACVAAPEIHTAEDILGRTSAMMMLMSTVDRSPDAPAAGRDNVRRPLTILAARNVCRSIFSSRRVRGSSGSAFSSSICVKLEIPVSGVLTS